MAAIKDTFNKVTGKGDHGDDGNGRPTDHDTSPPKYKLRVTAGPSYDPSTHLPLRVNSPHALAFENSFMRVKLKLRIRDYIGLPRDSPKNTPYFDDPSRAKDLYSIGFSFVPKVDLPSDPTRWGNDFDHPVRDRLPPGFNTAFRIVKDFIDPGLSCDAYADEPWLLGPALSCWFAFRIGDRVDQGADFPQPEEDPVLKEGADGSGKQVRDKYGLPDDPDKRRKFFLNETNRKAFVFEKDRLYHGDFFNPYLDFNNFAVRLPGFSLGVLRFIDDKSHALRYVFKNVETGDVYFVVVLTLLFGEQLKDALQAGRE